MTKSIPKTIDYVEIRSRNVARLREFCRALLGWKFAEPGGSEFAIWSNDAR